MKKILFIFLIVIIFFCCGEICYVTDSGRNFMFFSKEINGLDSDIIYFTLDIPSISFYRDVYHKDSSLNDVQYNIQLLNDSDEEKKLFFIAGHSGRGENCFFNSLVNLKIGDEIDLLFSQYKYTYLVDVIYYIDKTGVMDVDRWENTLYLITCSLVYPGKQLIIRASLIS